MTRLIFTTVFLLGASVIIWMGMGFIGSNPLALTIIAIIACVYVIGFIELIQFRGATSTLHYFLSLITKEEAPSATTLDARLAKLHPSLFNSVRLRIEGERVPLPAPVLSPYLVGLLVMLGLLGTFAGMVDTLKGAVIALEGTTELQAVRAGLAAPIKGLGLAFGTSVAGVAASAMLGLLSTLSRRDRMIATRILDSKISTVLRTFSLSFNRQETYRALQNQAQAFPEVVDKLELLTTKIGKMGSDLGVKLVSDQEVFHESVKQNYMDLAASVGKSLRDSLSESGRLTSEAVVPIFTDAIIKISDRVAKSVNDTHDNLTETTKTQLDAISVQVLKASDEASTSWAAGLVKHECANQNLVNELNNALSSFNTSFELKSNSLLESFNEASQSVLVEQAEDNDKRLSVWHDSFERTHHTVNKQLEETTKIFSNELKQVNDLQKINIDGSTKQLEETTKIFSNELKQVNDLQKMNIDGSTKQLEETTKIFSNELKKVNDLQKINIDGSTKQLEETTKIFSNELKQISDLQKMNLDSSTKQLEETTKIYSDELKQANDLQKINIDSSTKQLELVSSLLMENWQSSSDASLIEQDRLLEKLKSVMNDVVDNTSATSTAMISEISSKLKTSEELVATRVQTESDWLNSYESRVNQIVSMVSSELKSLVDAEQIRGSEATEQLAQLETTVATQLAALGNALEAPMTRLIETASETPRAAAEVISHLRREISNNIERDNSLLEERVQIIESLDSLFNSLEKNSIGQRDAVEQLVSSSSNMLKDVGNHFSQHIESEVDKLTVISDHFSGSAVEMASLGDAFSHSVELFNQSTGCLIENLSRIEESLNTSTNKSDEQMAYYIAQAREIIDHSVSSQQGIIDQLSQLGTKSKKKVATAEVV